MNINTHFFLSYLAHSFLEGTILHKKDEKKIKPRIMFSNFFFLEKSCR
jgi:hypothetical protein